jgi:Transposase IS66 family
VHKLDTFTDLHRAAQQRIRKLIWNFYADLKIYRTNPTKRRCLALRARFDRIFHRRTGFVTLDRLLARLRANKAALLMVLERPEIPLHTNGSENDIRCQVTRRKVSAGTRSDPDVIAATRSSAWPRPARRIAWRSGFIWAAVWASPASRLSRRCRNSSDAVASPPDPRARPGFCRCYVRK